MKTTTVRLHSKTQCTAPTPNPSRGRWSASIPTSTRCAQWFEAWLSELSLWCGCITRIFGSFKHRFGVWHLGSPSFEWIYRKKRKILFTVPVEKSIFYTSHSESVAFVFKETKCVFSRHVHTVKPFFGGRSHAQWFSIAKYATLLPPISTTVVSKADVRFCSYCYCNDLTLLEHSFLPRYKNIIKRLMRGKRVGHSERIWFIIIHFVRDFDALFPAVIYIQTRTSTEWWCLAAQKRIQTFGS